MKKALYSTLFVFLLVISNSCNGNTAEKTKKPIAETTRPIGEIWYDENDNKFEQKDGYVLKNCGCSDNEIVEIGRSMGVSNGSAVAMCCRFAEMSN